MRKISATALSLKIVLAADVLNAVKNVEKAEKTVDKYTKSMGKNMKKINEWVKAHRATLLAVGGVATGVFYEMIKNSPTLSYYMAEIQYEMEELTYVLGEELGPAFEVLADVVHVVAEGIKQLPQPMRQAIAAGIALTAVIMMLTAVSSPWLVVAIAIIAAMALLYTAWVENWGGIRDYTLPIIETLQKAYEALIDALVGATEWVYENVILNIAAMIDFINENFGWLVDYFTGVFELIVGLFTGNWDLIQKATEDIFSSLPGPIQDAIAFIMDIFKDLQDIIEAISKGDLQELLDAFSDIADKITGVVGDLFKTLGDWFYHAGTELIQAFINGLMKGVEDIGGALSDALDTIKSYFGGSLPERGPLSHIVDMGRELIEGYAQGIQMGTKTTPILPNMITNNTTLSETHAITLQPTIVVNASVSNDIDIHELATKISDYLKEETLRAGWV